jgi:hypothetical protein
VFYEHLVLYINFGHIDIVLRSQFRVCDPEKVFSILLLAPVGQLELVPEPSLKPVILDDAEYGESPPLLRIHVLDGSLHGLRLRPLRLE